MTKPIDSSYADWAEADLLTEAAAFAETSLRLLLQTKIEGCISCGQSGRGLIVQENRLVVLPDGTRQYIETGHCGHCGQPEQQGAMAVWLARCINHMEKM